MNGKLIGSILISLIAGCAQKVELQEDARPEVLRPVVEGEALPFTAEQACALGEDGLSQSSCAKGQRCVPLGDGQERGRCLIECGRKAEGRLQKDPEKCPQGLRCLARKDLGLRMLGYFCGKPQEHRDLPCEAPFDEEACLNGMSCLPTVKGTTKKGTRVFARPICKNECLSDDQCRTGESCLKPRYARSEPQMAKDGRSGLECSLKTCQGAGEGCTCDRAQGFACEAILPGIDAGLCLRSVGVCGEAVPLATLADFRGKGFFGKTCNETADNRFCKASFEGESKSNAKTACAPISSSGEGVCLALCSVPAFKEADGDKVLNCPSNFSCRHELARKLGRFEFVKKKGLRKACDSSKCSPGIPCPDECGPGSAECLEAMDSDDEKRGHFCGAPLGLCEPDSLSAD